MKVNIKCDDKYEAQKLAGLIFIRDAKETFVTSILDVIENELVISLKDKSAHSILLSDGQNAGNFADFIQSVIDKEDRLVSTKVIGESVEIQKEKV